MKSLLMAAGAVSILAGLIGGAGVGTAFVLVGIAACAIALGG